MYAQDTQNAIGRQSGFAQHLRQCAPHDAAIERHLPASFLCMDITHGHPGIARIFGQDVGHVAGIAVHLNGMPQAGNGQFTIGLNQASLPVNDQPSRASQQCQRDQPTPSFERFQGSSRKWRRDFKATVSVPRTYCHFRYQAPVERATPPRAGRAGTRTSMGAQAPSVHPPTGRSRWAW